jgi:hypothetical protein
MQTLARPLLFLTVLVSLSAPMFCPTAAPAGQNDPPPLPQATVINPPAGADMLSANTHAGDALAAMLLKRMSSGRSILSASMVEMDKLEQSSTFGRVAMQQVASRVAQHGFRVVDVRLTEAMIINSTGEFMLSRDVCKVLADRHDAYAVLVGVYTPAGGRLYVSVRALRLSDAAVIAAYEYYLPFGGDVSALFNTGGPGVAAGSAAAADPLWSRYAARGQSFADCVPQEKATGGASGKGRTGASAPAASRAPAPSASAPTATVAPGPKIAAQGKSPARTSSSKKPKKRRGASYSASQAAPAAPQPSGEVVSYTGDAQPICPQDVPSNRRAVPNDCNRAAPAYGMRDPVVYGESYVDRGGGRVIDPNAPPPAVGRLSY